MKIEKNVDLSKALSAALKAVDSRVDEVQLFAGQTLTLDVQFIMLISKDCVVDLEKLCKAKKAFIRTLRKALDNDK